MDRELEHYGILGMKWGVRRTPEQLGHTKSGKRVGHTIKKGTTFYRVSANPGDAKGPTYVTMYKPDRDLYRGSYSRTISKQQGGDGSAYETTYKSNKDLKIANRADILDEFKDLSKDTDTMRDLVIKFSLSRAKTDVKMGRIEETDTLQRGKEYLLDYVQRWNTMPGGEKYMVMTRGLTVAPETARAKFIKDLKKKGYDGYIDEAGVGGLASPREGVEPLVIFDADKTLTQKKSGKLTAYDTYTADQRYSQWFNVANSKLSKKRGDW